MYGARISTTGVSRKTYLNYAALLRPPCHRSPFVNSTPAPTVAKPQRKSRKVRWLKIGAIIGLVYGFVCIAAGLPSEQGGFFLTGYILGQVGLVGFVGFIAGVVADLINGRKKAERLPSPEGAAPAEQGIAPGRSNFIARHWQGALPLWMSYWVINFLGNLCGIAVPILIAALFASKSGYYPLGLLATFMVSWTCILVLACWQLVGTWRSATRYSSMRRQQGRHAFWGGLAQAAVIFGVLGTITPLEAWCATDHRDVAHRISERSRHPRLFDPCDARWNRGGDRGRPQIRLSR